MSSLTAPTLPADACKWKKLGLIYKIDNKADWAVSHAMVPTPLLLEDRIRVFYSSRSKEMRSHIGYVDLDRNDPSKVIGECKEPVLAPGRLGTFDDSGVTCDSAVQVGDKVYLYYIGWNQGVRTPYHNTIGLAISDDQGKTFHRHSEAPIIERNADEPFFCTSPWVLKEGGLWHLWYACITEWILVNDKPECIYHIKYAHSKDGIEWQRDNIDCILPLKKDEANVRPTVIKQNGVYRMWYCYRGSYDFRDGADSYRLGYAESNDGKNWSRIDSQIEHSGLAPEKDGWDTLQQAYPAVIDTGDKLVMFYNGNGFGAEGFGCAVSSHK